MRTLFFAALLVGCGSSVTEATCDGGAGGATTTATTATGGAGGATATTASAVCNGDCDDGNFCTTDVCLAIGCQHFGASSPIECATSTNALGRCAWGLCVVGDCAGAPDGTACIEAFPTVGACADGVCL